MVDKATSSTDQAAATQATETGYQDTTGGASNTANQNTGGAAAGATIGTMAESSEMSAFDQAFYAASPDGQIASSTDTSFDAAIAKFEENKTARAERQQYNIDWATQLTQNPDASFREIEDMQASPLGSPEASLMNTEEGIMSPEGSAVAFQIEAQQEQVEAEEDKAKEDQYADLDYDDRSLYDVDIDVEVKV